ncbi:MAG: hypothetical protein KGN79_04440 [Acidobacteriota bacterium]|nr:hypothetical protein [Acidobacteriota bacterium]
MDNLSGITERSDLIKKLVVHGHVNVAERNMLGFVKRQEVADIVKSLLLSNGVFPIHNENGAVFEGPRLFFRESGAQIKWERAYPWDPYTVAERRIESFSDIESSVQAFIDSAWKHGIDGVLLS